METLTFTAELKKVQSRKTASLDMEYTVTLVTDNSGILALGALPADSLLNVEIGVEE